MAEPLSRLPRIAVTCGEPAGIGPDIVAALTRRDWPVELIAVGDPELLVARAASLDFALTTTSFERDAEPRPTRAGSIRCLPIPLRARVEAGRLDRRNAAHVVEMLAFAGRGALDGTFDAIVTAPVHKGILNDAGIHFTGHTEFFAAQAGCEVLMLLVGESLRIALATTHVPLARVPQAITPEVVEGAVRRLDLGLRERFGLARPRLAVLGLNPHAGEGGHLGCEELLAITPIVRRLAGDGIEVEGPLAADTAFVPERRARYDAYLAMYHDQGLPVLKALAFGRAVNVTLGLPYVRTSVDHGTALDRAGTGQVDPSSLATAVDLAIAIVRGHP